MSVVYTGLGIFLLFADTIFIFSGMQQTIVAVILIVYGLFRGYKAIKKRAEELEDDNEE